MKVTLKQVRLVIIWAFATLALATMVHLYTYHVLNTAPQENEQRVNATVRAVCDWARDVNTQPAFRACGVAQNESMTEYVCDSTNTSCWIEDKR